MSNQNIHPIIHRRTTVYEQCSKTAQDQIFWTVVQLEFNDSKTCFAETPVLLDSFFYEPSICQCLIYLQREVTFLRPIFGGIWGSHRKQVFMYIHVEAHNIMIWGMLFLFHTVNKRIYAHTRGRNILHMVQKNLSIRTALPSRINGGKSNVMTHFS